MCSCMWSVTASIIHDTKYARRSSLLGKVLHTEHRVVIVMREYMSIAV